MEPHIHDKKKRWASEEALSENERSVKLPTMFLPSRKHWIASELHVSCPSFSCFGRTIEMVYAHRFCYTNFHRVRARDSPLVVSVWFQNFVSLPMSWTPLIQALRDS